MSRSFHVSLSVKGALGWSNAVTKKALKWLTKSGGVPYGDAKELRAALMDELASGNEHIPVVKCDNFDPKTGCLGHEEQD